MKSSIGVARFCPAPVKNLIWDVSDESDIFSLEERKILFTFLVSNSSIKGSYTFYFTNLDIESQLPFVIF